MSNTAPENSPETSAPAPSGATALHHATTVTIAGKGVLIEGPSGSGKSALALQLMAFGAALVADDSTLLQSRHGQLWATAPAGLPAAIEARGVGLLRTPLAPPTPGPACHRHGTAGKPAPAGAEIPLFPWS